jgi:tRNA(Ile)-lysidine synthase
MQKKFHNHIIQNFPFLTKSKFFIAASGGIDSMVLVHLFQSIEIPFAILHCNFQLRGKESDDDMEFVRSYAETFQIPFAMVHFETVDYANEMKVSTQVAARELRYNWFNEQLDEKEFDYVLTAHHADDSLETFVINLSRGTGLDGLLGIPARNNTILRPMLPFTREEIEHYAKENDLKWREDSSNASDKYLRNKIRHDLVPVLKDLNPHFMDSFLKTIQYLNQSKSMVEDAAGIIFMEVCKEVGDEYHFHIKKIKQLENANSYLFHWLHSFGFTAWDDIYNLVDAQSGKQVFSETHVLLKDRNDLILSIRKEVENETYLINKENSEVNIPLKFNFCQVTDILDTNSNSIFVDEDAIQFPLVLRKWNKGDYFYPFGMNGKKKLSKYFKDEKLSLIDKSNVWLLCSDNQIVWIVKKRQDNRFKVTEKTTKIIQITLAK